MTDNNLASFAGLGGIGSDVWPLRGMEIISRAKLKDLRQRRNGPGLFHLAAHAAALTITGFLVYLTDGSWLILPAWILYGSVIVLLFAPLHESSHGTAFRTRWLNAVVGFTVGAITQRPFLYFKYRHSAHHTYTQHEELDPDIVPFPSSLHEYFALILGASFWPKLVGTLYRGCTGRWNEEERSFIPESVMGRVSLEIRLLCLFYLVVAIVSIATGSWFALTYWMIPRILGEPVLRAIRMAEHTGAEESPNLLANTRTTLANRVFRTLYWNMPFHAEHHLASSVPFHALDNLHTEVRPHLLAVGQSYYQVHRDILRQILSGRSRYPIAAE
jgi:fatty acid desaturase